MRAGWLPKSNNTMCVLAKCLHWPMQVAVPPGDVGSGRSSGCHAHQPHPLVQGDKDSRRMGEGEVGDLKGETRRR